jgi:hypothetical protein
VRSEKDGRVVLRVVACFAVQFIELRVALAEVFCISAGSNGAVPHGRKLWLRAALSALGLLIVVKVE